MALKHAKYCSTLCKQRAYFPPKTAAEISVIRRKANEIAIETKRKKGNLGHTEATKRKLSEMKKGKVSLAKHSEKSKQKMREAALFRERVKREYAKAFNITTNYQKIPWITALEWRNKITDHAG